MRDFAERRWQLPREVFWLAARVGATGFNLGQSKIRRTVAWSSLMLGIILPIDASAAGRPPLGPAKTPNGASWGELALLPEYCRDAMGILYGDQYFNPSPRAGYWVALIGPGFWNIHHYCYALNGVRRAESAGTTPQQRRYLYGKAIADYYYVVLNSPPDLPLLPEIFTRLGEAYVRIGELPNASAAFEKARALKPDYWPAYSRWIDVLLRLKKRTDAADLALLGLKFAPGATELRRQYASAGGDPAKLLALTQSSAAGPASGGSAGQLAVPEPKPPTGPASANPVQQVFR